MQLELGKIVEGKVTGITKFGAFVELEPGKVGLVHISEIATSYVNDIAEHLQIGQTITAKILSIGEDGKISLSIRQAAPPSPRPQGSSGFSNHSSAPRPAFQNKPSFSGARKAPTAPAQRPPSRFTQTQATVAHGPDSFEAMLGKFMKNSDEKISQIKKGKDAGRRSRSKRPG